jgi:hypothetical protein
LLFPTPSFTDGVDHYHFINSVSVNIYLEKHSSVLSWKCPSKWHAVRPKLDDDKCGLFWGPWIVGLDGKIWPKWWHELLYKTLDHDFVTTFFDVIVFSFMIYVHSMPCNSFFSSSGICDVFVQDIVGGGSRPFDVLIDSWSWWW